MTNSKSWLLAFAFAVAFVPACAPSPDQLKKVLEEHPDIVFNTIEKNPDKFMESLQKAQQLGQEKMREREEQESKKQLEEELKNPKQPVIGENRVVHWNKEAPITIVEYSDFQCPYCTRGYQTMVQIHEKYGDKVRLVYKHLPLDFHPQAMPAAKYYEAIGLQDKEKAVKFHDMVFANQQELGSKQEKFLSEVATKVGANMAKLKKDLESDAVKNIIAEDMAEAKKYGFDGTPGFLVNGVSVRGAYPPEHFSMIIDKILAK